MNFRKSKSFGGVRITTSKGGLNLSTGIKGARVSINSKGKINRTIGIPGTGIYDRKKVGSLSSATDNVLNETAESESYDDYNNALDSDKIVKQLILKKKCAPFMIVSGSIIFLISLLFMLASLNFGYFFCIAGIFFILLGISYKKSSKYTLKELKEILRN